MTLANPIALNADEYEVFWLQLPAVTLSKGLTLTVTGQNGATYQRVINSSITLERRNFYTLSSTVENTSVAVTSVSVAPTTLALNVNETGNLAATVLPENATDKSVTWSSSNASVASVDADGKVTGVAAGTATITATTTDGGKTATCAVTVKDVISYSLAISPKTAEINALASQTYVVKLTTVKNGVSSESEVEATLSTSDFGVATVDGLVAT
ncbi:MAG: Ig domain-containing protein, partial [Bacteroidales bacterium]|nr:Ig domain-containing protein [Bacteroidales bacterium]